MKNKLVLDFGGTFIKYAVADSQQNFIEKGSVPAPVNSLEEFLQTVDELVRMHRPGVDGIAISMAGRIDAQDGFVYQGGAYRFLQNIPLAEQFQARYGLPVSILNDANAATLAEARLGNLKDVRNGLAIIIGTGIGAGIVLNGILETGTHCNAGELSGLVTNFENATMYGTFCATNSTRTLLREYSHCCNLPIEQLNGKLFFEKIPTDHEAQIILDRFCYNLALQIYNVQCLLDLERAVIGGGISQQPILTETVRKQLDIIFDRYARFHVEKPEVMACHFHNDSNLYGALLHFEETVRF